MDRRKPVYYALALSLSMTAVFAAGLDRMPRAIARRLATPGADGDEAIERIEPSALAARGGSQLRDCARKLRGICAGRCRRAERRARTISARILSKTGERFGSLAHRVDALPERPAVQRAPGPHARRLATPR